MTHYIDATEPEKARYVRAVCGVLTTWAHHDVDPTCPACAAKVSTWAAAEAAFFDTIGYVEIRPGVMGPRGSR